MGYGGVRFSASAPKAARSVLICFNFSEMPLPSQVSQEPLGRGFFGEGLGGGLGGLGGAG